MNVMIKTHQVELPGGHGDRLARRFRRAFGRLGKAVERVRISLKSASSKPGVPEKICQMDVSLNGGGHIVVTGRGTRMARAIGQTLRRARFLVRKEIGRQRSRQRRFDPTAALPAAN